MGIVKPTLYFGRQDAARVLKADVADQTDDGAAFAFKAETVRLAPAGGSGECVFRAAYVVLVTDTGGFSFTVTPLVDGVALEATTITVPAVTSRLTERYEIPLSVAEMQGGVERLRTYPRGVWCQVRIEATTTKHAIFGAAEVEYQVVRETRRSGAA